MNADGTLPSKADLAAMTNAEIAHLCDLGLYPFSFCVPCDMVMVFNVIPAPFDTLSVTCPRCHHAKKVTDLLFLDERQAFVLGWVFTDHRSTAKVH